MAIQYVPWEDKELAKQQLAEYVKEHPEAKLYFDLSSQRPDTCLLHDGEDIVAEISLKFLEQAVSDNESIGDGVSFRDVIKKTKELNPGFFGSGESIGKDIQPSKTIKSILEKITFEYKTQGIRYVINENKMISGGLSIGLVLIFLIIGLSFGSSRESSTNGINYSKENLKNRISQYKMAISSRNKVFSPSIIMVLNSMISFFETVDIAELSADDKVELAKIKAGLTLNIEYYLKMKSISNDDQKKLIALRKRLSHSKKLE